MIVIGIDLSLNCTGLCIFNGIENVYYMLPTKMTKKMKEFKHKYINIIQVDKILSDKNASYREKEKNKTINIRNICASIEDVIIKYKPSKIIIEGIAYNATGTVADLSGLNYCVRMIAIKYNIDLEIISPTSVKQFAVGNGRAEKDVIIDAWKRVDNNINDIEKGIKIDDLSDAYFIAHYGTQGAPTLL